MILQEVVTVPHSRGKGGAKREENLNSIRKTSHPLSARVYQPPVPYSQRVAWARLFQHEPKFARFLDALKQIYADTPFLEAIKEAPAHLKFLRELLSKKGDPERGPVAPIGKLAVQFYRARPHLSCKTLAVSPSLTV